MAMVLAGEHLLPLKFYFEIGSRGPWKWVEKWDVALS